MNWLTRESSDGRRTAGYGLYLLVGLAVCGMLFFLHGGVRLRQATPGRAGTARARASNVAAITQPAAVMARVEVAAKAAGPETGSFRMPATDLGRGRADKRSGAHQDAAEFNAIDEALAGANEDPVPAGQNDAGASPAAQFAELLPAFPPGGAAAARGREGATGPASRGYAGTNPDTPASRDGLLGYRDLTADLGSRLGAAGDGVRNGPPFDSAAGAPREFFAPRGSLIYAYLLTTVDTSNPSAVIQFAAGRSFYFNRRCQVPFGTRFLGKLAGGPLRDRVNLVADTLLYPDGLELPVNATAVEADDAGREIHPGVAADYFPPPLWAQAAPYFADFFTGTMGLLASRAQQQFAVGVGGVSLQTTSGSDLKAPLYQASAQAVQDYTQARLKEYERRYPGYYLVPAGTACWLQLDADLNLAAAQAERGGTHLHEN